MKYGSKLLLTGVILLSSSAVFAECFTASGKAFSDAQSIRKVAASMGWKVGKSQSITAGTFIKGKAALYPQSEVRVCLRVDGNDELVFKAQSSASDAGEAEWRNTFGKRR